MFFPKYGYNYQDNEVEIDKIYSTHGGRRNEYRVLVGKPEV
jgi:hypothetical protein